MTSQIAVKLPETMLAAVDDLVAQGHFDSRSAAVRAGLDLVTGLARREAIDAAYAEGFKRVPETREELDEAHHLAIGAIEAEPWEPWW